MIIGTRIKRLRTLQHRTLQELADTCGFSKSLLSKIETGKVSPPVATLSKIAVALQVKVSALLDDEPHSGVIHTRAEQIALSTMIATDKGYLFHLFAGSRPDKRFQPYLFVARKGEVRSQTLSHAGEEFIYVLEGEMNYRVGEISYHLKSGDSLFFDSVTDHDLEPVTDTVKYLAVFSELSAK